MGKKGGNLTNIPGTVGIVLLLGAALAVKDAPVTLFLAGLALLALRVFEVRGLTPRNRAVTEMVLSASVCFAAVSQLVLARGFRSPQFFAVVLLLGAVLVLVEAARTYSEP